MESRERVQGKEEEGDREKTERWSENGRKRSEREIGRDRDGDGRER